MPPFTLSKAAKACKRSKSTLLNALHTGLLSGSKDERGNWSIEPAELFRVYPLEPENRFRTGLEPIGSSTKNHDRTASEPIKNQQNGYLYLLKTLQAERDRERQQLQATIDDLRQRLDAESRKVTALLTHQKESIKERTSEPTESKLYQKLFGKH